MKRTITVLTLAALTALLLCAGCAAGEQTPSAPESTQPTASESPSESTAPAESVPPVDYDFSAVEIDPYTRDLTGFEGLPWGYQLPQSLVDDLGGIQQGDLVNSMASFAGLSFQAHYLFNGSSPGTEEGARVLVLGQYVRMGYAFLNQQTDRTEMAVSDFNQTLAYLTELYGEPVSRTVSYTQNSGRETEDLTAPLTLAQVTDPEAGSFAAFWHDLDNGVSISLQLSESYGGMLSVTFGHTQNSVTGQ